MEDTGKFIVKCNEFNEYISYSKDELYVLGKDCSMFDYDNKDEIMENIMDDYPDVTFILIKLYEPFIF